MRIVLALLVLAVLAAPADAAVPRFLGSGADPGVAVDAGGTAHVAWFEESGATQVVRYCQVPRGGKRCAVARVLALPDDRGFAGWQVHVLLPAPGAVQIVAPRVNGPAVLFGSADGGTTFASVLLGELNNVGTARLGPGPGISVSNDGPAGYARYGFDGSGPAAWSIDLSSATEALDTDMALLRGRPIVFFSGDAGMKSYRWTGVGDPNDQATWVPGPAMPYGRWYPSLASGRSGTFLAYTDRARDRWGVFVRRVRGNGFGRPRRINDEDPLWPQLVQWPNGALTVIWNEGSSTFARHSRRGRRWSRTKRLFTGNEPSGLRVAVGRRGGWLVWDGDVALSTSPQPIRILRLRRPRF
jgi:hypothetical protein